MARLVMRFAELTQAPTLTWRVTCCGIGRVKGIVMRLMRLTLVIAVAVGCGEALPVEVRPPAGVLLTTDSVSYYLNHSAGRVVDLWVENASDSSISLASCNAILLGLADALHDGNWMEAEFACY